MVSFSSLARVFLPAAALLTVAPAQSAFHPQAKQNTEELTQDRHTRADNLRKVLTQDALERYAGRKLVIFDTNTLGLNIPEDKTFADLPSEERRAAGNAFMKFMQEKYPAAHDFVEENIASGAFEPSAYDYFVQGFVGDETVAYTVKDKYCFLDMPADTRSRPQTFDVLDMLVAVHHNCNTRFFDMTFDFGEGSEKFRPRALLAAFDVARREARIPQKRIDDYVANLLGARQSDGLNALLAMYVGQLGIKDAKAERLAYQRINKRAVKFMNDLDRLGNIAGVAEIVRRAKGPPSLEAFLSGVWIRWADMSRESANHAILQGLNPKRPLFEFVNKADGRAFTLPSSKPPRAARR